MERIAWITPCIHCEHAKWETKHSRDQLFCEILSEKGEPSHIRGDMFDPLAYDLTDKCENSFKWDGDILSVLRDLEWLSERWSELKNAEYRLAVVRIEGRDLERNKERNVRIHV